MAGLSNSSSNGEMGQDGLPYDSVQKGRQAVETHAADFGLSRTQRLYWWSLRSMNRRGCCSTTAGSSSMPQAPEKSRCRRQSMQATTQQCRPGLLLLCLLACRLAPHRYTVSCIGNCGGRHVLAPPRGCASCRPYSACAWATLALLDYNPCS
jgi:hypothetical protein